MLKNSSTHLALNNPDLYAVYADALRPPPDLTQAQFAVAHRVLHSEYCVEHPGPWTFDFFPLQEDIMNCVDEAIATGKQGIVDMKGGQVAGTDAMITAQLKLKIYYPGPQLFMTATDKVAEEFGRQRFKLAIRDMKPLHRRLLEGEKGQILVKRFVDGNITLCGGQSVFNLQSSPYRIVVIDEVDSLSESMGGDGDPIKLAQVRTRSFSGETLIIAYAHPTTKEKGAGKIYYQQSDQRRAHIKHSCGHEFWIDFLKVFRYAPREDQSLESAEKDPDCWYMACPGCAEKISDAERVAMLRGGIKQKSILPPQEAAKKTWIGVSGGQLYTPHRTIRSFAEEWIGTDCGRDEEAAKVFWNKTVGDVYETKTKKIDISALRSLAVVKTRENDPEYYRRGQVPPAVLFLTAGQDSRQSQFHYTVWGWGIREAVDGTRPLCGWLIDWGQIAREKSIIFHEAEYHVFDDLIYRRRFPCTDGERFFYVRAGAHDIGYQPTQIPIIRYCRNFTGRAMPCRGASETPTSASHAQFIDTAAAKKYKIGDSEVIDDPAMVMNTYMLKTDWYGRIDLRVEVADMRDGKQIGTRKVPQLTLPADVGDRDEHWLDQTKNEKLGNGKKKGEKVWTHEGPNHLADCNTYAYGVALSFDPHARNMTAEEYGQRRANRRPLPTARRGSAGGGNRSDNEGF